MWCLPPSPVLSRALPSVHLRWRVASHPPPPGNLCGCCPPTWRCYRSRKPRFKPLMALSGAAIKTCCKAGMTKKKKECLLSGRKIVPAAWHLTHRKLQELCWTYPTLSNSCSKCSKMTKTGAFSQAWILIVCCFSKPLTYRLPNFNTLCPAYKKTFRMMDFQIK